MQGVSEFIPVTPVVGKLVLFPGWLPHCVLPLLDPQFEEERVSVAFNFFLR